MGSVTTSLTEQAESIFAELGYQVSSKGGELRAERKWRTVHVTPMPEPNEPPDTGEFRCFVTYADRVDDLERELEAGDPEYEWAIIGISEGDDYEVATGSKPVSR